jgi:uncharacterized protein YutE (UPF0331/DUF86 family)
MVEGEGARRLLGVLLDVLADLERYRRTIDRERLRTDRDAQYMVLHALYVAAQAAIDLALHLGAYARLPEATSYQDAFHRLAEAEILDALGGW